MALVVVDLDAENEEGGVAVEAVVLVIEAVELVFAYLLASLPNSNLVLPSLLCAFTRCDLRGRVQR